MLTMTPKYPAFFAAIGFLFIVLSIGMPQVDVVRNSTIASPAPADEMGRLVVSFDAKHNKVTADTTGPKEVSLVQLQAMNAIDFKRDTSLFIRVIKDGVEVYKSRISELVPEDAKRGVRSIFINPQETFANFQKLEIIIEERTHKIPFKIDAVLQVK